MRVRRCKRVHVTSHTRVRASVQIHAGKGQFSPEAIHASQQASKRLAHKQSRRARAATGKFAPDDVAEEGEAVVLDALRLAGTESEGSAAATNNNTRLLEEIRDMLRAKNEPLPRRGTFCPGDSTC